MVPRFANWVYPATKPMAAGSIIEQRTLTCRYDEGSGRCSASARCEVCRNSRPSTAQSTITSTRSAISTAERTSSRTAPPRLTNDGNSVPARAGNFRKPETGSSLSDSTVWPDVRIRHQTKMDSLSETMSELAIASGSTAGWKKSFAPAAKSAGNAAPMSFSLRFNKEEIRRIF